ncbi:alpha-mannosyltransferase [Colletotrichum incanum]|nr:alpha-mannosyltransferase [Colletotrichum incanum]
MFFALETGSYYVAKAILGISAFTCCLVYLISSLIDSRKFFSRFNRSPSFSQPTEIPSVKIGQNPSYVNSFPPSQRAKLAELGPQYANVKEVDLAATPKPLLKLDADYRTASPNDFNFSGFSIADIQSLGDFPDYATLSGVPLPSPLNNFNIDKAVPRPYRPFRWAYHQTMSLTKMDTDFWIELENTYKDRIVERQELYAKNGEGVLAGLPGSELACKELMEMVIQFICARYPNEFKRSNNTLINNILGTTTDLSTTEPLVVLLHNVPEDFGIMIRDHETGRYVLRAGMVCSSVGWKISEKMGMGLPGIHKIVPDYKEKMEFSMDRFFTKMPTNRPIQRGSWGLEMGQPLFLPSEHPAFAHRESQNPNLKPEDVYLRVDWQTLRRLPLSGAVVFNFKALFTPLSEFKDEPYIPSIVLKVLNEGKESILKYKGTWHVEHVAKPALREYEKYQVENGLIERDWETHTLPESPFFEGWERKWTVE